MAASVREMERVCSALASSGMSDEQVLSFIVDYSAAQGFARESNTVDFEERMKKVYSRVLHSYLKKKFTHDSTTADTLVQRFCEMSGCNWWKLHSELSE